MTSCTSSLDEFAASRAALTLAFGWGLAEATFFFIVPDVLLILIACRALTLRPVVKAKVAALVGAIAGGALMYSFGVREPQTARVFLDHVPTISPALIAEVERQTNESGLLAVLIGPVKGIPYRIRSA